MMIMIIIMTFIAKRETVSGKSLKQFIKQRRLMGGGQETNQNPQTLSTVSHYYNRVFHRIATRFPIVHKGAFQ